MSIDSISIELRLDILPNNQIQIPGCEPISELTSTTLAQRWKCQHTLVHLRDVLALIPEARVEYGSNWGQQGTRKKWLVLPPRPLICCQPYPDWYALLRTIGVVDEPIVEKYEACDVIGQGFCPSPGFSDPRKQPVNPYLPEGATPYGVAVTLGPWVPPWQGPDKRTPNAGPYNSQPPSPPTPEGQPYGTMDELFDP